ncbi:maleylpyruvate isomerase family mycothiol-dependent enzyme [Pseudarthrobacter sp. NamB4]|uniref:maleylpyruvate isomerase family mycothiol-dependent enzyme n=1 Tax=Pseudarthrobacter sp. NamB4 TaxID=2576837 RepID=UPI0010FDFE00|nr:maleylpyruvate isomerase family mycothiol-dependent enzyme [Pseudarthrobacter sp. NamB4]TLM75325.1 maleylpyruvate isomerase family mycothiol-dependent enzyme [Pseudarthrobacter sp. NamB4]
MRSDAIWRNVDLERKVLAEQLAPLTADQWASPSLCQGLSVREVLAHLTVSGSLPASRWLLGVLRARFDFDKQVDQRLREQLGSTPAETLQRFRATVGSRTAPPLPRLALLGEMIVHGEDIRRQRSRMLCALPLFEACRGYHLRIARATDSTLESDHAAARITAPAAAETAIIEALITYVRKPVRSPQKGTSIRQS